MILENDEVLENGLYKKKCVICYSEFRTKRNSSRCCSKHCLIKYFEEKKKKQIKKRGNRI